MAVVRCRGDCRSVESRIIWSGFAKRKPYHCVGQVTWMTQLSHLRLSPIWTRITRLIILYSPFIPAGFCFRLATMPASPLG